MSNCSSEWEYVSDKEIEDYHMKQFETSYRSTSAFHDWLNGKEVIAEKSKILDLGCGTGANLYHFNKFFPGVVCSGIDISDKLISIGQKKLKSLRSSDIDLICSDFTDYQVSEPPDGVISYQVLSWLENIDIGLEAMVAHSPKWIAATSLFFNGPISCITKMIDHADKNPHRNESFCNTYSLRETKAKLLNLGYVDFDFVPFNIDLELPKPKEGKMGTYTEKLSSGDRLQISGPMLMNWHFIFARKNESH